MKYGWKVVCLFDLGRRACSLVAHGPANVHYTPGQWAIPPVNHGPLAVFEDHAAAWEFTRHVGGTLLPCAYIPSDEESVYRYRTDTQNLTPTSKPLADMPDGSRLANAVMLLAHPMFFSEC